MVEIMPGVRMLTLQKGTDPKMSHTSVGGER